MNKVLNGVLTGAAALAMLVSAAGACEAESYTAWCVTDGSELNIRKHNWLGSERIGYVCNGWDVEVDMVTDNGWARIVGGGEWEYGYCKIEYLTCYPDGAGIWYNSSNGRVRIRETMNGKTTDWLKAGKSIKALSWAKDNQGNDWAYTKKGWILGEYLTKEQ